MPDEPDPPRKFYGFKPREFDVANPHLRPPLAPDAAPAALDPGIASAPSGRIEVRDLNRLAATGQPLLSSTPAPVRENDLHGILRENLARADAAGLNDVKLDPNHRTPRARRIRRFWIALVVINVPLGAFAFWVGPKTAIPFVCSIAAIGILTSRLIWDTFFLNTD